MNDVYSCILCFTNDHYNFTKICLLLFLFIVALPQQVTTLAHESFKSQQQKVNACQFHKFILIGYHKSKLSHAPAISLSYDIIQMKSRWSWTNLTRL